MAYIGRDPAFGHFETQDFTGDGTTTAFTIAYPVSTASSLAVWVGSASQVPETDFIVQDTTLTFTTAPGNTVGIKVVFLGRQHIVGTVADGSVTNAKLNTNIDAAKIGDGSVSNTEFQYINSVTSDVQTQITANTTAIGNVDVTNHTNPLNMEHETTPATPAANNNKLYFKNDNQLYKLDSAGNERIVGGDPEGIKTNAADIFTNFVKDMEVHGISALHTEAGFVDEMETAGDMINETAGTHSGTYSGNPIFR